MRNSVSKYYLTFFFIACLFAGANAQQPTGSVSGVVKDSEGKLLDNVSVLLMAPGDSIMVAGTVSDKNGYFVFKKIHPGSYTLQFTRLGFAKSVTQPFTLSAGAMDHNAATTILQATTTELTSVVVQTRKPLIQAQDDKLVFNVDSDPSLQNQMAVEALRKTPFVVIDGEGNIQMAGKKSLKILLNGKATGLMAFSPKDVLKSFPASLIKRIEVITDLSARYDAEGTGGVINIVTKRGVQGYRITTSVGGSTNFDAATGRSLSTNFAVKIGRFGVNGYLLNSYNDMKGVTGLEVYQSKVNSPAFYQRLAGKTRDYRSTYTQGDFELSWDLDSLSSLSGYGTLRGSGEDGFSRRNIFLYDNNQNSIDQGNWEDRTKTNAPTGNWGLDYTRKFRNNPSAEFSINWNLRQSRSDNSSDNSQDNQLSPDRFVINTNNFKNTQHTFQSDLVMPLANRQSLEVGAKAILREASSDYQSLVKNLSTNQYQPDPSNTNRFNFRQNVWGAYTTYRLWIGKFRVMPGLRMESTRLDGQFKTSGTAVQQNYTSLFPNVTIRRSLGNGGQSISLNYTRSLARPDISYLNPFVNNNDPLFVRYGNPLLKPEFGNRFALAYSYNKSKFSLNATVEHEITSNEILAYSVFNPATGVTTTTYDNLGKTNRTSLSLYTMIRFSKKFSFNAPMNLFYANINGQLPANVSNRGWGASGNINFAYAVASKLNLYYSSSLLVPNITLQGRPASRYHYSMIANLLLLKGKMGLNLSVANIFSGTRLLKQTLETAGFLQVAREYEPARSFSMSLSYNISKLKENISRKKGVQTNDLKILN